MEGSARRIKTRETHRTPMDASEEHSVRLHDEINCIIAVVGLCSLSEQG